MGRIYHSVEELIGHTPIVDLKRYAAKAECRAHLLGKLEFMNPAGSVKDRVAREMLNDALEKGLINQDTLIIEPTSGNTGIGLAAVAASRGYKAMIVMPDTMSVERQKLMKAYGAELVLSDGKLGMSGAIQKAEEIHKEIENSWIAGQFYNPANPAAHRKTTGPEIWEDTDGEVDILVCGVGTGGTITGTAEYLKSVKPGVHVVAVEPTNSAVLSGKKAGPHGLQGIGAGFIPDVLRQELYDEVVTVSDDEAYEAVRALGRTEGLLCGISSGAALHAAVLVGKRAENAGKNIVVILPDTGERYLSTTLFD